jgi:hypothetical protein
MNVLRKIDKTKDGLRTTTMDCNYIICEIGLPPFATLVLVKKKFCIKLRDVDNISLSLLNQQSKFIHGDI